MAHRFLLTLVLLGSLCTASEAAIVRVAAANTLCSFVTTCNLTVTSTGLNNFVMVAVATEAASITSVTDNGGGGSSTYTSTFTQAYGGFQVALYTTAAVKASVTQVTVTVPASADVSVIAVEYSGLATSSVLDQVSAQATGTVPPQPASGNITTTQADELLIGLMFSDNSSTNSTAGTNFGNIVNQANAAFGNMLSIEDRIVSSTGTYSAPFASQPNDTPWMARIASYKMAAAGGVTAKRRPLIY